MGTGNVYLGLLITSVAVVTFRVSPIVWKLTMTLTQYFREKTEKLRKRNEAQGREENQGEWTAWYQREVMAGHIDATTITPPPGQADRADQTDFPEGK